MRESEARRDAGICLRPQANWWNTHSEVLRPGQGQGVTYLDKQEDLGSGSASLQVTEGPGQGNSGLEAQSSRLFTGLGDSLRRQGGGSRPLVGAVAGKDSGFFPPLSPQSSASTLKAGGFLALGWCQGTTRPMSHGIRS